MSDVVSVGIVGLDEGGVDKVGRDVEKVVAFEGDWSAEVAGADPVCGVMRLALGRSMIQLSFSEPRPP